MIICILNVGNTKWIESRLVGLGFHCQRFNSDIIKELDHGSEDLVYLVPSESLHSAEWPQLRVRLSQANRYYIVTGKNLSSAEIVNAARDGAYDVMLMEDSDDRWISAIQKVADSQKLWMQLYGGTALSSQDMLIGASPPMKSLRQAISRLGPTGATVLIEGESGVGKERVASMLHKSSGKETFVAVNCAAIPKELIETELFGAERGAYTGSFKARPGLVEQANGGTLFLDEIGELDFALQPKLLRFLETRRARRVGGSQEYEINVRVLSATNSNLEQELTENRFRADLYYRLSEIKLHVPPLRSRLSDIPHFALAFAKAAGERFGKHFEHVEPELVQKFQEYHWPGNVRELKNTIDRLVILYDGPIMRAGWWSVPGDRSSDPLNPSPGFQQPAHSPTHGEQPSSSNSSAYSTFTPSGEPVFASRKQKIEMARRLLKESNHDLTWVAAQLGINTSTLYRWRKANKI